MNDQYSLLYARLLSEIEQSKDIPCFLQRIEYCFQAGTSYIMRLREEMFLHPFSSAEDEIEFFREIKPLFTTQTEYYNLLYHGYLFRPVDNPEELHKFWLRESMRLEKFADAQNAFYLYFKQGRRNLDAYYFTRYFNEEEEMDERNLGFISRGDMLVG